MVPAYLGVPGKLVQAEAFRFTPTVSRGNDFSHGTSLTLPDPIKSEPIPVPAQHGSLTFINGQERLDMSECAVTYEALEGNSSAQSVVMECTEAVTVTGFTFATAANVSNTHTVSLLIERCRTHL